MELSLENIRGMGIEKIYAYLLPLIDELCVEYQFLCISDDNFREILKKEISPSMSKINGDVPYLKYMKKVFLNKIYCCFQEIAKDDKEIVIVLNGYINQYVCNVNDYKKAILNLLKISRLINTFNIDINPNVIVELINMNKKFNHLLKLVVNNKNTVIDDNLRNDNWIMLCLEVYCELNNTRLYQDDNEYLDNLFNSEGSLSNENLYLQDINRYNLLTAEEERELFLKAKQGDRKARNLLINCNQKLVVYICKRYMNRGLEFLDLIQEGNVGLIKAVEKYDLSKLCRFSTYATWEIMIQIERGIVNKGRNIRIPVHIYQEIGIYKSVRKNLEHELEREPFVDEIAEKMKISINKVKLLQKSELDTLSLYTPLNRGDEEDYFLYECIEDDSLSTEEIVAKRNMTEDIQKLFNDCSLSKREIGILSSRFGLNGEPIKTLEQAGKDYNIGRERARQIEQKALDKIRKSISISGYVGYMDYPDKCLQALVLYRKQFYEDGRTHIKKIEYFNMSERVCNNIKHEPSKRGRKIQSIYKHFNNYSKKEIDYVISLLTEEEKKLLKYRYGDNLECPVVSPLWTKKYNNRFYSVLLVKIKELLELTRNENIATEDLKIVEKKLTKKQ